MSGTNKFIHDISNKLAISHGICKILQIKMQRDVNLSPDNSYVKAIDKIYSSLEDLKKILLTEKRALDDKDDAA